MMGTDMRIVALADTHGRHNKITSIPNGDMVIHAGDFTGTGSPEEVMEFAGWFSKLPHPRKVLVAGNHDFCLDPHNRFVEGVFASLGILYLCNRSVQTPDGLVIYGSPMTPEFGSWAFMDADKLLGFYWRDMPQEVDILVTHGPPYEILDRTVLGGGSPAGSRTLREKVEQVRPKVHIFGHIHEGYGGTPRNGIMFYNVSVMDERYRLTNPATVIEVEL